MPRVREGFARASGARYPAVYDRQVSTIVHLGGRFIDAAEAHVSFFDGGYLLGDGLFATMRGYRGVCFRADRHLADLARGAELFGLEVPQPIDDIIALANEAAGRTGAEDAYVRVTLTRGVDAPTLSVLARPMLVPSTNDYTHGVATVTVRPRRIPPACMDPTLKTTSYAASLLARREAEARGAFEGIQLAVDGSLASATMANVFLVVGRDLLTPSGASGCRAGITRAAVLELAPALGLAPQETVVDPALLLSADEVFLTSTRLECLAVASVDGVKARQGPHVGALRDALRALV